MLLDLGNQFTTKLHHSAVAALPVRLQCHFQPSFPRDTGMLLWNWIILNIRFTLFIGFLSAQNTPNEPDQLFKTVELEVRGADPAVLKSYEWFARTAASHLGITVGHWYLYCLNRCNDSNIVKTITNIISIRTICNNINNGVECNYSRL